MSKSSASIPKQPERKAAEDFYRLRREGISFIEEMGSHLWTDYNLHDPGITILEALCYAITDLSYRIGWDMQDILAHPSSSLNDPFPNQPFFTAREILTVNPLTPEDFRRLLIDMDMVRNAWVVCKQCTCEAGYHAWCENDQLTLSYKKNTDSRQVQPLGLYDVLLELETDPELGDLNDRKIERTAVLLEHLSDEDKPHVLKMELRFPEWANWEEKKLFSEMGDNFTVKVDKFSATKIDNVHVLTKTEEQQNHYLQNHWREIFYIDFTITSESGEIIIHNAAFRIFADSFVRGKTKLNGNGSPTKEKSLVSRLEDTTAAGFIHQYREKISKVDDAIIAAKNTLHQHRNIDEDYCCIRGVDVEDVAVCADVELTPDADIERVQARIWFEIEQYFNQPVPFYSLQEMMDADIPVEEIFNGPSLHNGFIKTEDLEAAELKNVLRTSDIINRIMDIDGVISVNNLLLSHYDSESKVIKGRVDPTWHNGTPVFNTDKSSAEWVLFVSPLHQPRLYHDQSRFLFLKNGLPFLPRMDEARDELIQLRGKAERPKISKADNDLPVPTGTYRDINEYFPVQYSLPAAYGIGPEGLPVHASSARRAQAKQLKAYLMIFEQILGNAFAQLAHTADLFSLNLGQTSTYFAYQFSKEIIKGYEEIVDGLDQGKLEGMTETRSESLERRNRFLDHILARFGEQFSEYALMLTNLDGKKTSEQLIKDKITFLKTFPQISSSRNKAFNYTKSFHAKGNIATLSKRIGLMLGSPDLLMKQTVVVEHLLLRPKFPGDALYPACSDGECKLCGDEDPYSFRLTFVMLGWIEPYSTNMEMRNFAERTIRREIPSHLLCKICWVAEEQFNAFHNAWEQWLEANASFDWTEKRLQKTVQAILADNSANTDSTEVSSCASAILAQYGHSFHGWIAGNVRDGKALEDISGMQEFASPDLKICPERFGSNIASEMKEMLDEHYRKYVKVSYHLQTVVNLLSALNSIYPAATLHDCDEGNDQNPVRLGKTVLGNISR